MEIEKSRPQRTDSIVPIWVLKPENKDSVSSSLSPDLKAERKKFFLLKSFILFRPSVDWFRPIHIDEGNLPIGSNANLSQKHLHRHIQNNV